LKFNPLKVTVEYVLGQYPRQLKREKLTPERIAELMQSNYGRKDIHINTSNIEELLTALKEIDFKVNPAASEKLVIITDGGYQRGPYAHPLNYPETDGARLSQLTLKSGHDEEITLKNDYNYIHDAPLAIVAARIVYQAINQGYELELEKINSALDKVLLK